MVVRRDCQKVRELVGGDILSGGGGVVRVCGWIAITTGSYTAFLYTCPCSAELQASAQWGV
jgi:hypothetical protein